jgi:uncharacterized protein
VRRRHAAIPTTRDVRRRGDNCAMTTARPRRDAAAPPLDERDIDTLQALLDEVPKPLEPLDVTMLDGYLCGVLVQPDEIPVSHWFPHVCDADGRALPPRFNGTRLHALVMRRHRELREAIQRRVWFDPWVFELADEAGEATDDDDDAAASLDAVYPWVAGFATAVELFPGLMQRDADALTEPLALLYRHLEPEDLEDADALLAEIESLEPPADLSEAVEGLVRATLLLADVAQPQPNPTPRGPARGPRRPGPPPRR